MQKKKGQSFYSQLTEITKGYIFGEIRGMNLIVPILINLPKT